MARFDPEGDAKLQEQGQYDLWKARYNGSLQEWYVFQDLENRGLEYNIDFRFRSERDGGLQRLGNAKVHFEIAGAKLKLRVQAVGWENESASQKAYDLLQKIILVGAGWFVVDLLADELTANTKRVMDLAFQYQNTPRAAGALAV